MVRGRLDLHRRRGAAAFASSASSRQLTLCFPTIPIGAFSPLVGAQALSVSHLIPALPESIGATGVFCSFQRWEPSYPAAMTAPS